MKYAMHLTFLLLFVATALPAQSSKGYLYHYDLSAGTMVTLELTEQIESSRVHSGDQVYFRALAHVEVNSTPVIKTGALAIGKIKSIEPGTFNFPEKIKVEVTHVQAADGQMVPVNGQEQVFEARRTNEEVVVTSGKKFTAFVANNITIKL